MTRWLLLPLFTTCPAAVFAADTPAKISPAQVEFFETKVRPILADHCYSCHGAKKQSGGLRLDSAADLKAGVDGKPVVIAGDVQNWRKKRQRAHLQPMGRSSNPR